MIPFCLEVLFQAGNCFCPTQVNFPALIPAVVLPCYMSPEQIVTVTAAISILMAFLQPVHPSLTRAQTLQEQRISSLDKVITGTKAILQACGHPQYLDSLHDLWHQASQDFGIKPARHCSFWNTCCGQTSHQKLRCTSCCLARVGH